MSKIARITSKIFASAAGFQQRGLYGSLANGLPVYSTDPAAIQAQSNWLGGWFSAILGNNSPAIQDVNSVDFVLSYLITYILQAGVAEWDAGTTYYTGSFASSAGVMYVSLIDNNTNNPLNDGVSWVIYGGMFHTPTTTYAIPLTDDVVRMNTTSGAFTATLPAVATSLGKKYSIVNVGTNKGTIQGNAAENIQSANTYDLNPLDSVVLFCNGVSWDVIG